MGSVTPSLNAYGQPNETASISESATQILSDNPTPPDENEESTDQLISENASNSDLNIKSDKQNTLKETNLAEEGISDSQPDGDCLFDPSLPKCAPDENGNCPEGFAMNEDGQCFPQHDGCPDGYHGVDDDETGRCIPNSNGCPTGMIFRPDEKSCGYKDDVCKQYPNLEDCKSTDEGGDGETKKAAFDSGYNHGCSDSKIPDESKRYIHQPGKGPNFHTTDFMNGYHKGFDYCSTENTNDIPYDSGYKHGCNDTTILDVSKRYINQPGRGPSFHTPDFMDGYNDGFADCIKPGNKGPVADAGPANIEVIEGETVTLDATKSYDPDGQIVKYEWRNGVNADPGCPYGTFMNKNTPTPQFTPPDSIQSDCSNYYEVVVTDNDGKRGVDAILITVTTTSNSSDGVIMSTVHQSSNTIHVGDKFGIGATITNNLDKPIHYISPDCGGRTLDVELDKKVDYEEVAVCQSVQEYTLGPHESQNVGSGIPRFIATELGQMNAQVTFDYSIIGSNENPEPLTKSFSFDILP